MKNILIQISLIIICLGCSGDQEVAILLDLAQEHDEGRFNPEAGDQVFIAGNFNEWQNNLHYLSDNNSDWVYEIKLTNVPDTLSFKFGIQSSINKDLANRGWEVVPNRTITKEVLLTDAPVLEFNKSWKRDMGFEIPFAVSMSNQQVLGFFDPDKDKVVVTGSFMEWDPLGIELQDDDNDLIYETTVPVSISNGNPEQYKYRIIKREASIGYLPNNGWEFVDDRLLISDEEQVDYFNDQKRIARFQISESYLRDSLNTSMKKGDMLQIRLTGSDFDFLSSEMIKTKEGCYEISVQIPMKMSEVRWYLVKNVISKMHDYKTEKITQHGKKITIN